LPGDPLQLPVVALQVSGGALQLPVVPLQV